MAYLPSPHQGSPAYQYAPGHAVGLAQPPVAPPPGARDPNPTSQTPMGVLENLDQAFISQKMTLGTFTCCQTENKYRIYSAKHKGQKVKKDYKLFKCKEHSTCLQRYCVP